MANDEHLARLREGVDAWNAWRKAHRRVHLDLSGANLSFATLSDINLYGVDLSRATLNHANLSHATLREAKLNAAHLISTDLSFASLAEANLSRADLSHAILKGADLGFADLTVANLTSTNLSDAILGYTLLTELDLSRALGLESVEHNAPSSIGIDTIYKSRGKIPEAFLRGCGVPDQFITYMRSLVAANAIEYYSAFISYSSQDEEFARRLYADLQTNNVRCWFAPEDMKIGDEIRTRIDESIRLHDKLLLVLSEHSLASNWVKDEVESAFEQENRRQKLVLFPVRLDAAVEETTHAWAAKLRRQRHIGDFTRWKDHDAYQQAFTRLLRDLRAEAS